MRDHSITTILFLIVATAIFILLQSCETWRGECNGDIIVVNTIPDTTLYVNGEPFIRDPFKPPVIFRHTTKESINITLEGDIQIVQPDLLRSEVTERLHVIKLSPRNPGTTLIKVIATDDCEGREAPITFNVTILDTTQQKF